MKHLKHYFLIQGIHGLASLLQYATRFWMVQHATRKNKLKIGFLCWVRHTAWRCARTLLTLDGPLLSCKYTLTLA